MIKNSIIYDGKVIHRRFKPKEHYFKYKVFSLLIDIDELETIEKKIKIFSYNKFNIISFFDIDHGPRDGTPIKNWIIKNLKKIGINSEKVQVKLLCYPRIFGYVFNPLSIFFIYDENSKLISILYEVKNTFGEQHTYIFKVEKNNMLQHNCFKKFHVSPFIEMNCNYFFRILKPSEKISVVIDQYQQNEKILFAQGKDNQTKKYFKEKKYLNNKKVKKIKNIFPASLSKYQMFQRNLHEFNKTVKNKNVLATRSEFKEFKSLKSVSNLITSGVSSWKKISKMGILVNSSLDSFGENYRETENFYKDNQNKDKQQNRYEVQSSSIVWSNGLPWVYIEEEPFLFVKKPVSLENEIKDGWLVTSDALSTNDIIVSKGAQLLLSEEYKYQIKNENED